MPPPTNVLHRIPVPLGDRSYEIVIGENLLPECSEFIAPVLRGQRIMATWDAGVATPHAKRLLHGLSRSGLNVEVIELPGGEACKGLETLSALWDRLLETRLERRDALIVLGGGAAGDLVGFAAATYLRGIDFIQIPTTLLAMVDAAVGGKTAINHPRGKNLIGAFWQPRLVLADLATLQTLPEGEITSALSEIIKYGVIRDAGFFAWLEDNIDALRRLESEPLAHAVKRSCEIKAEVVAEDERESGLREILNFGHTIGHAVEAASGYGNIRHGEAVAIGMVAESKLSLRKKVGDWRETDHQRLVELCRAAGLPTEIPTALDKHPMLEAARRDKKNRAGEIRCQVPAELGRLEGISVPEGELFSEI